MSVYQIVLSPTALKMLKAVQDRRIRRKLAERIDGLSKDPDKQGKALVGEFAGLRSLRAVGQRYRIIYRVKETDVTVYVLAVGLRKEGDKADIYALMKQMQDR